MLWFDHPRQTVDRQLKTNLESTDWTCYWLIDKKTNNRIVSFRIVLYRFVFHKSRVERNRSQKSLAKTEHFIEWLQLIPHHALTTGNNERVFFRYDVLSKTWSSVYNINVGTTNAWMYELNTTFKHHTSTCIRTCEQRANSGQWTYIILLTTGATIKQITQWPIRRVIVSAKTNVELYIECYVCWRHQTIVHN